MPFPSLIWLALLLYGDIVLSLGFRQARLLILLFFPVLSLYFDPKLVRILISYILPSLSPKYSQSTEYNQRKAAEIDEAKYRMLSDNERALVPKCPCFELSTRLLHAI